MSLSIPSRFPALTGLDFREPLEARLAGAIADRRGAARCNARLALRCAWSKQHDFAGECAPWLAAWTNRLAVKDRMIYRWEAAGRCLILHPNHWEALHLWPLECLEMIVTLNTQEVAYIVARYRDDPAILDRARLAELVARFQERPAVRGRQPAARQPALPGLEALLDFTPEELDPVDEARRAAAHFERFARAYELDPAAVPDAELEHTHAVAAAAAAALAEELRKRQERVA